MTTGYTAVRLRETMPSGTPDPFIAMYAEGARTAAQIALRWKVLETLAVLGLARPKDALDDPQVPEEMFVCHAGCPVPYDGGHAHFVVVPEEFR